jgi:hypothetical protein
MARPKKPKDQDSRNVGLDKKSLRQQVIDSLANIPDNPPRQLTIYLYDLDVVAFYSMYPLVAGRDRSRLIEDAMRQHLVSLALSDPRAEKIVRALGGHLKDDLKASLSQSPLPETPPPPTSEQEGSEEES